MLRISAACSAIVLATLFATGCCCIDRPYCPTGCNDGFDPVLGSCSGCGSCGGECGGHTPTQVTRHRLTCGSGCGELYWGEWISTPPDPCDPCDGCGNHIGERCCSPRWWQQLTTCNRWGGRNACGDDCGGCSSCGGGEAFAGEMDYGYESHAMPASPNSGQPRPATPPGKARSAPQPQRARQPLPEAPLNPEAEGAPEGAPEAMQPMDSDPMETTPIDPNLQTRRMSGRTTRTVARR